MFNKTLVQLMDFFQESRRKGESAQLFLETRNHMQFATLKVQLSPHHHQPNHPHPRQPQPFKKRKSPSQLRRDHARLRKFREKAGVFDAEPTTTPPSPPTARSTNTTETRRMATPRRKLGTSWQSVEEVSSPIPQLD